jgi:hypothetical protein
MLPRPITLERMDRMVGMLWRLFNRGGAGWGERGAIDETLPILAALAEGRIRVRLTRLPLPACVAASSIAIKIAAGESAAHSYMKVAARNWMALNGATDAVCEVSIHGGRADVYSRDKNWIVECGNTAPYRLVSAIEDESHPRFTLIPYQGRYEFLGRRAPARSLAAADFEWDDGLGPEIMEIRLSAMKEAWRNSPPLNFTL